MNWRRTSYLDRPPFFLKWLPVKRYRNKKCTVTTPYSDVVFFSIVIPEKNLMYRGIWRTSRLRNWLQWLTEPRPQPLPACAYLSRHTIRVTVILFPQYVFLSSAYILKTIDNRTALSMLTAVINPFVEICAFIASWCHRERCNLDSCPCPICNCVSDALSQSRFVCGWDSNMLDANS